MGNSDCSYFNCRNRNNFCKMVYYKKEKGGNNMSEASLEKGVDKPGGRISSIPIEHRGSHSQMLSPDTLTDGQIEEDFLAAFTPPQIDQSPESSISKKDKEKLIIPFNSTRINPD